MKNEQCLAWYFENSTPAAWLRRLGVRAPLGSRYFPSQNFDTFTITSCLESNMNAVDCVNVQLLTVQTKLSKPQEPVIKTRDRKCDSSNSILFGMHPQVGGSHPLRIDILPFLKTATLSQEHPFVSPKWTLLPVNSWPLKRLFINIVYIYIYIYNKKQTLPLIMPYRKSTHQLSLELGF